MDINWEENGTIRRTIPESGEVSFSFIQKCTKTRLKNQNIFGAKWAKLRRNSKKPANFAGFCSWYLNTTGYMVDDNGLEPLTLRTSSACSTSWANRPSAGCIIQDSFPFVKPFFQNLWKFFFPLPCSPLRSIALAFPGRNGANPAKKQERIEKSPWLSALWMVK